MRARRSLFKRAAGFAVCLQVYVEAYHTVPKGICKQLVRGLAWLYYVAWGMFPVLFVLGPEGFSESPCRWQSASCTIIVTMHNVVAPTHSVTPFATSTAWAQLAVSCTHHIVVQPKHRPCGLCPSLARHSSLCADHMNIYQSYIAHNVLDLLSKNVWGLVGHILRLKVCGC